MEDEKESKPKRKYSTRGKIRDAILQNATSPEPIPLSHLSKELGITERSVYANVNYMRRKGLLAPSNDPRSPRQNRVRLNSDRIDNRTRIAPVESTDPNSSSSMDAVPIMTEQEALRRLSWTARFGPLALRQQAQKDILASARQSGGRIGPPEPMTLEEVSNELARLMLMSGEEAVRLAIKIAYPKQEEIVDEKSERVGDRVDAAGEENSEQGELLSGASPHGPGLSEVIIRETGSGPEELEGIEEERGA